VRQAVVVTTRAGLDMGESRKSFRSSVSNLNEILLLQEDVQKNLYGTLLSIINPLGMGEVVAIEIAIVIRVFP
jgi:hypothetical protein